VKVETPNKIIKIIPAKKEVKVPAPAKVKTPVKIQQRSSSRK